MKPNQWSQSITEFHLISLNFMNWIPFLGFISFNSGIKLRIQIDLGFIWLHFSLLVSFPGHSNAYWPAHNGINSLVFLFCGLINSLTSLFIQSIHYQFNFWHSAFFLDSISISIIQLINEIGIEIRKKKAEAEGVIQSEIHAAWAMNWSLNPRNAEKTEPLLNNEAAIN